MNNNNEKDDLLLDMALCSWNEKDMPLNQRGVSLAWIIDYVNSIYNLQNESIIEQYIIQIRNYRQYDNQKRCIPFFTCAGT